MIRTPRRCCDGSVSDLPNDRRRAARAEQELPELSVNVLVAAAHEELDVFKDVLHDIGDRQRLRLYPRTVAVVDAVVPALEDLSEALFQSGPGRPRSPGPASVGGKHVKRAAVMPKTRRRLSG